MNRTVQRVLAALIIGLGLLVNLGYVLAVAIAEDRGTAADEWGSLAGFGLFGIAVGVFWILASLREERQQSPTTRMPPVWLSFLAFTTLVGVGFGLQLVDRAIYVGPLLAILAFVAVGAFFLGIAARWMPDQRLPLRSVVMPGAWGVFVAPTLLMIIQGGAVGLFLVAIVSGIYSDNPEFELDPNLDERISSYVEEMGTGATTTELPEIVESSTVALTLFSVIAIIAPLSEELIKAAGAIIVLARRDTVTRSDAFFAAVAAGLGFALFEGVGYTLAATSSWHQLILFRAPVVVMHVAATTIVVIGWYRMRTSGRGFVPYFLVGTALHAGWNALYVGFIYSLTGIESGTDPSSGQALGIASMVLLLGALFISAVGWFLTTAHKTGKSEDRDESAPQPDSRSPAPSNAILQMDSP